ncbi:antibiotic biosynthesis monooxygenase family protein [Sphingomonas aracearum]|uniref:Antibiotic biosynthesis monooxygenase n=1 Tax=Sphingomonas aracearum TaxID=2283317 RepID=A0A369VTQ3_9SPHN|nr:antibiotic biosynthesis monooxygenase [Sphingomonas aracearum]RDE05025.1 antibiotic biosynthesis monooxygenase [Sphingomonas aracearum]
MGEDRHGQTAIVFTSARTADDEEGYSRAARAMEALAAEQPGFRGMESARGADGIGITVSYWANEESAVAWRAHADHRAIREQGRERWYDWYRVTVARVERGYSWTGG